MLESIESCEVNRRCSVGLAALDPPYIFGRAEKLGSLRMLLRKSNGADRLTRGIADIAITPLFTD